MLWHEPPRHIHTPKFINSTCSVCLVSYLYAHDFRAEHLVLDNQSGSSFLREILSPALRIPKLPVVLCLWVGSQISTPMPKEGLPSSVRPYWKHHHRLELSGTRFGQAQCNTYDHSIFTIRVSSHETVRDDSH